MQLGALRDSWKELEAAGAVVYGVNPFDEASHRRFAEKHAYPFRLIVDKGGRIARAYRCGLWLLVRSTVYVTGPDGRILWARRGRPSPAEILAAINNCATP